jgi:pimeloyl-ACP methyl ester carboxylesterase
MRPMPHSHGTTGPEPLWTEIADFLRSSLARVEHCTIEGVGHLLHIQRPEPVAHELTTFLARHPISSERPLEVLQAG